MSEAVQKSVQLGLFPTMDSAEAVIQLGISQLPITNANQLVCLMMALQNTLLAKQNKTE